MVPGNYKTAGGDTVLEIGKKILKGHKVSVKVLTRIASKLNLGSTEIKFEVLVKKNLEQVNQQWRELKNTAAAQRDTFMESLAGARSQTKGTRFEGVLNSLRLQKNSG